MSELRPLPASEDARTFAESRGITLGEKSEVLPATRLDARDLTDRATQFFPGAEGVAGCDKGCSGLA